MHLAHAIGFAISGLSSVLLIGEWAFPELTARAIPGVSAMAMSTTFAFLLASAGLMASGKTRRSLGIAVAVMGAITLLQASVAFYPADGYWRLLLNTRFPAEGEQGWPGRMSLAAAISFLSFGIVLAATERKWEGAGNVLLQSAAGVALAFPLIGLHGFLLGMPTLYADAVTPVFMSFPTASGLLLSWVGLWLSCLRSACFSTFYNGREDRQLLAASVVVVLLVSLAAGLDEIWLTFAYVFSVSDMENVARGGAVLGREEFHFAQQGSDWYGMLVMLGMVSAGAVILWRYMQPLARRLHQQEKLLENVLHMMPDGVWIADHTGRITLSNPAGRAIWCGAELVGMERYGEYKAWWHDTGEPVLPDQWGLARAVRYGETSLREVLDIQCFDGTRKTILNSALPLRNSDGMIMGAIALNQDITEDIRMLETLRHWEQVFRHAGWGIVISRVEDNVLELMNAEFARMHGYRVEELTGRPIADVFAPEAWPLVPAQIALAHERGHHVFESLHRRKDGSIFPVSIDVAMVHDDKGRIRYRVVNVQDISERQRIETERLRLAEMQAAILDALPARIALIDGEGIALAKNRSWEEFDSKHGNAPCRLAGAGDASYPCRDGAGGTPCELDAAAASLLRDTGRGFDPYTSEYLCVVGGLHRWFRMTAVPFTCGRSDGAVIMHVDISDLKNTEQALRVSESGLSSAQAQAHLGSWQLDAMNNILEWSDETYRIFGIARGAPVDYAWFLARVHPDDRAAVDRAWRAAVNGERYDIQHRIRVNGQTKWVRERADIEFSPHGEMLRAMGTVQDITELKETEHYLESSRAMLRALAARREAAREEERKHIAREIHDELGQLLTALRMDVSMLRMQFAASSPLLADKLHDTMQLADLTIQVVRNVASSLRPAALDMGIGPALEWLAGEFSRHAGIPCELSIDEDHMQQDEARATAIFRIVQESLTNVARHAGASRVWVTLKLQDGHCLLEVRDDGKGFDPLAVRNRKSFGLVGMRERAIALGGEFGISSALGQGTTLSVSIPLHANQTESKA